MRRIIGMLDEESPEGQGVIINRCRPHSKTDVLKALDALEDKGIIKSEEGARKSLKYTLQVG